MWGRVANKKAWMLLGEPDGEATGRSGSRGHGHVGPLCAIDPEPCARGRGKIVHDPFHLVQYMNEAVNEVRKGEHRRLQAMGDDILKNTRQLWLYGMENVPASTPGASMRSRKSIWKRRGRG